MGLQETAAPVENNVVDVATHIGQSGAGRFAPFPWLDDPTNQVAA
jgi:hypothetical protein